MKNINTKSISFRLIAGGCILVLLPLIVIGFIAITKSTDALMEAGKANAKSTAHEIADVVETSLDLQSETLILKVKPCFSECNLDLQIEIMIFKMKP